MIKSITVTNHLGESITMELRNPESSGFLIRRIDGLTPSKAFINTTESANIDGSVFNSAKVGSRNIVFHIDFYGTDIETIRQKTYQYFPIKRYIEVLIETDNRICKTVGYVESNEPDIFSKEEGSVISIICPDSYLYDTEIGYTYYSVYEPLFEFPFSNESTTLKLLQMGTLNAISDMNVHYTGDASVGIAIRIHALGEASNVKIVNGKTGESMELSGTLLLLITGEGIHAGDDILITTVKGSKNVILIRDGVTTKIMNCLEPNPDWFELEKGDNTFACLADTGRENLVITIENQIAYEGI